MNVLSHPGDRGPTVVLLHGLGDSPAVWRYVTPRLSHGHQVYALDLPGLGNTPAHLADYSARSLAERVVASLNALDVHRAVIVGNSLGGQVALHIALAAPERVTGLVLLASSGLGRAISPALRAQTLPGVGEAGARWGRIRPGAGQRASLRVPLLFARPWRVPAWWLADQYRLARMPLFLEANLAALRANVTLTGQREVLIDRLGAVDAPSFVLWGAQDQVLPVEQGRQASSRLGNAGFAVLPACGHALPVEAPQRVTAAIAELLNDVRAPRPGRGG